jgi:hypothetical protein
MSENKCFACHGKGCYMCAEKQPLTWEDVDLLSIWYDADSPAMDLSVREVAERYRALATRITAYLPPRNK